MHLWLIFALLPVVSAHWCCFLGECFCKNGCNNECPLRPPKLFLSQQPLYDSSPALISAADLDSGFLGAEPMPEAEPCCPQRGHRHRHPQRRAFERSAQPNGFLFGRQPFLQNRQQQRFGPSPALMAQPQFGSFNNPFGSPALFNNAPQLMSQPEPEPDCCAKVDCPGAYCVSLFCVCPMSGSSSRLFYQ